MMLRHILPNIFSALLVQATVSIPGAIIAEAILSFLGLGVQPPTPSWGTMLNAAQQFLETAPWMSWWPGLAIFSLALSFNLAGDGLRRLPRSQGLLILPRGCPPRNAWSKRVRVRVATPRQVPLGLGHRVIGMQVHFLVLDALPQALDEEVVAPGPSAVHAERRYRAAARGATKAVLVNWLPWSVFRIPGQP